MPRNIDVVIDFLKKSAHARRSGTTKRADALDALQWGGVGAGLGALGSGAGYMMMSPRERERSGSPIGNALRTALMGGVLGTGAYAGAKLLGVNIPSVGNLASSVITGKSGDGPNAVERFVGSGLAGAGIFGAVRSMENARETGEGITAHLMRTPGLAGSAFLKDPANQAKALKFLSPKHRQDYKQQMATGSKNRFTPFWNYVTGSDTQTRALMDRLKAQHRDYISAGSPKAHSLHRFLMTPGKKFVPRYAGTGLLTRFKGVKPLLLTGGLAGLAGALYRKSPGSE